MSTIWAPPPAGAPGGRDFTEDYQSFLANSLEEALSGAIKLVRYARTTTGADPTALVLDLDNRLTGFASAELSNGDRVPFLPGIRMFGKGGSTAVRTSRRVLQGSSRSGSWPGPAIASTSMRMASAGWCAG